MSKGDHLAARGGFGGDYMECGTSFEYLIILI